ncbi:hypothetical protein D9611_003305 [Ephemerocybe angulata]|uniref:J domain-containing protein n=1 Tax=Ephemerocybe angulata TaxID=980116 RepID=A0A8H5CAR2_9AGAR|nr:hypothetical protein D9611_003305 [Tulosesus angulatus]
MSSSTFPDYYKILNLPNRATQDEVKQAYRKESLKTHPDRLVNATPAEKRAATEKFQAVADAYYVLSDPKRRREYDALYGTRRDRSDDPTSSSNFFSQFAGMFAGAGAGAANANGPAAPGAQPDAEGVFADLLRPEVNRVLPWWSWVGTVSGAGIGFIVANLPGAVAGAVAGNRLGAIRDAKGKSVAAVFSTLGGQQKADILRMLAMKVLGSAL